MGMLISRVFSRLSGVKDARMLILGLDAAGKSTMLYRLALGETVMSVPTVGFNVETVEYKGVRMTMFDVGGAWRRRAASALASLTDNAVATAGQERLRRLWRHYYEGTDGLIFMVDTTDRERLSEAAAELHVRRTAAAPSPRVVHHHAPPRRPCSARTS